MNPTDIINKVLEASNLELKDFALRCGIAPDTLKKAMRRNNLSSDIIQKIHDKTGVRKEYLKSGKGDIFNEKLTPGIKNEQSADLADHPLVKSYVNELETLRKLVKFLEEDNARLRGK